MIPDAPFLTNTGLTIMEPSTVPGLRCRHDGVKGAIPFIEKSHAKGKPFFINLWIHEPHTPFHVDPKLQKRFVKLGERMQSMRLPSITPT